MGMSFLWGTDDVAAVLNEPDSSAIRAERPEVRSRTMPGSKNEVNIGIWPVVDGSFAITLAQNS